MNGTDKLFRARVTEWLSKEKHTPAELAEGATMVLQCNRNQALYNTIMRRPERYEEKIAYELRKHLRYLKDEMTLDEVKSMEARILPVIGNAIVETEKTAGTEAADTDEAPDSILPSPAYDAENGEQTDTVVARGKRSDHDQLPENIRAIWEKNAERYKKIKQAHETCKTLTAACDRYEYTKAISELWTAYKKDFDTYDHYVLVPGTDDAVTQTPTDDEEQLSAEDMKAVILARPYISKNLPVLLELKKSATDDESKKKYDEKLAKVQERVDVLVRCHQVITDDLKAQLTEAGITLETTDTDEQGQKHSDDSPAAQ